MHRTESFLSVRAQLKQTLGLLDLPTTMTGDLETPAVMGYPYSFRFDLVDSPLFLENGQASAGLVRGLLSMAP